MNKCCWYVFAWQITFKVSRNLTFWNKDSWHTKCCQIYNLPSWLQTTGERSRFLTVLTITLCFTKEIMELKCSTVTNLEKRVYSIFKFVQFTSVFFSQIWKPGETHIVACACNLRVLDPALIWRGFNSKCKGIETH